MDREVNISGQGPKQQRQIRIALPEALYQKLKDMCPEHGDVSRLVRQLLIKHLAAQEAV